MAIREWAETSRKLAAERGLKNAPIFGPRRAQIHEVVVRLHGPRPADETRLAIKRLLRRKVIRCHAARYLEVT